MQSTSPTSGRSTVKFSRTVWRAPLRTVIPWCLAVTSNKSSSNDPQIQELLKRNPCLVLDYQCCVDKRLSLNFHPFVQFTALSEQFDNFPNIKTPWRLIGKSASAACLMLVTVGSGKTCFQCFHDQSKIPFIVTTKFVHRCLAWICHLLDNGNFSSQRTMISWFSTWCTNSVSKAKLDKLRQSWKDQWLCHVNGQTCVWSIFHQCSKLPNSTAQELCNGMVGSLLYLA